MTATGEDYSANKCWGWWWRWWWHFSSPTSTGLSTSSASVPSSIPCWIPPLRLCILTACNLLRWVYRILKNTTFNFSSVLFLTMLVILRSSPVWILYKMTEKLSPEFVRDKMRNPEMKPFSGSSHVIFHPFPLLQCYLELRGEPQLLQGLPRFSLQCIISITTVLPPLPPLFSLHHLHLLQVHIHTHQLESSVKQSDRYILSFMSTSCSLFSPLNTQVDDQI